MNVIESRIHGVKLLHPRVFEDERGFFLETYTKESYQQILNTELNFVQDNHSRSYKHVLRGLHFQTSRPQGKLVRVVRGKVFDVAIDIRPESPTFGQWEGVYLDEADKAQFWLPPGLAHGFVVLSDYADFEYKCTDYYDPAGEACLLWNDPDIGIEWPVESPLLSPKDAQGKLFKELFR